MGQRGNYIIKTKDKVDIFYTHWRANLIVNDLLLGAKKFINFARQFDQKDELINEPWIEGCVLIDMDSKKLLFWETEQLFEFSVRQKYLDKLEEIWSGWEITFAEKEMYDIENELNVNYTSRQEKDFEKIEIEKIINDSVDDYVSCLVIIKRDDKFELKKLYSGSDESIALLGTQLISILDSKPSEQIQTESSVDVCDILLIDCDNKTLLINQNITGLENELVNIWDGWDIEAGNFGYVNLLEKAGYDSAGIRMYEDEISERMSEIMNNKDDFDPVKTAEKILETDKYVKFNPDFFENVKPKKPIWERLIAKFKRK